MKRILAILVTVVMIMGLCSCGSTQEGVTAEQRDGYTEYTLNGYTYKVSDGWEMGSSDDTSASYQNDMGFISVIQLEPGIGSLEDAEVLDNVFYNVEDTTGITVGDYSEYELAGFDRGIEAISDGNVNDMPGKQELYVVEDGDTFITVFLMVCFEDYLSEGEQELHSIMDSYIYTEPADASDTEVAETASDEHAIMFADDVLYDENDVVISASNYGENSKGVPSFDLIFENNSGTDYEVQCYYFAVNNIMVSAGVYDAVNAGKKLSSTVDFESDYLDLAGIDEVDNITFAFDLVPNEGDVVSGIINMSIREVEPDNSYLDGETIYSSDDLDVKVATISEDRSEAYISVVNNTDEVLAFNFDSYSVNDYMDGLVTDCSQASGDVLWSSEYTILPNSQAVCYLAIDGDFAENNGIEEIESIEFKLSYHVGAPEYGFYQSLSTDTISLF